LHLLPQARKASEDGHQRVIARKREQADDVDGLILRLNETLVDLKHSADNLTIFFGDDGRQHLALRIEEFGVLGDSLRRLVAGSGDNGQQTLRGFGRAEPLVLAIRDRLDDWESTQRINELWRGERVINVVAGGLLALILFAPRWLPAVAVVPITFFVWRVWIVAHHRTAIRKLVARLPLRLPGISSS
jgi:hypothetical protein